MFKKLLLIFALVSCHQLAESFGGGFGYNMVRYIQAAQALKLDDKCSWEAEEVRQNYSRQFLSGQMHLIFQMANEFVEKDWKLCSALELYVCDKESQKCVCGDGGYESLKGVNRALYTEENKKCRWNTGTYCTSDDFFASQRMMGIDVDSKCKTGTTCKTGNGDVCSRQAFMQYLLQKYGFLVLLNQKLIQDELLTGKICSCKTDQISVVDIDAQLDLFGFGDKSDESLTTDNRIDSNEDSDDDWFDAPLVKPSPSTTTTTEKPRKEPDSRENSIFSDEWMDWGEEDLASNSNRQKRSVKGEVALKSLAKYATGPVIYSYLN